MGARGSCRAQTVSPADFAVAPGSRHRTMGAVDTVSEPRAPRVAGQFYPGGADALAATVRQLMPIDPQPAPATALVGPHAGYVYSGSICGETWGRVEVPSRAIVVAPNHTGRGRRRSIWNGGPWQLPGFQVEVDRELTERLVTRAGLEPDREAHLGEHALEVHLPFLHARRPDVKIAAITLAGLDLASCHQLGEGMAHVIAAYRDAGDDVLMVASTDMSHYEPAEQARERDRLAIDRVLALDPEGLYQTVRRHGISMCGYVPTTIVLFAARALGAQVGQLVRYGNSGDASGDYHRVVGYAGMIVR